MSLEARIVASTEGIDAAAPLFRRAIAALEEEGALSQACDTRLAFAFFSTEDLRLDDARDTLDGGNRCESVSPMHRAVWPNYRAIVSLETMDVRRALRWVDDAILHQRRLGLDARLFLSVEQKARLLRSVGRFEDAASLLNRTLPEDAPCQRAMFANQRAWTAMIAAEAQRPLLEVSVIEQLFAAALEDAPACGSQVSPFIRLNLAFLHVELHRADEAEAELLRAEAELTGDDARTRAWRMELRGHIARLRGRHDEALSAFARLDAFGVARADEQARWRAALGRGRTLEIIERWEEAVEAYRAAERSVDRQLALVPFGEGRASFADARSPGTLRLLNVLLRLKRIEEAALVARRSLRRNVDNLVRASRLSALDAESRSRWEALLADYQRRQRNLQGELGSSWQLAEEESRSLHDQMTSIRASLRDTLDAKLISATNTEPRRPATDEVMLVLHPLDTETWAAFALTAEQTRIERIQTPADIVERFAPLLRAKAHVVLVAPGALEDVDFHALDLDGRPLGETKAVRYALDLAVAGNVPTPRRALIARDRTGTLRNADAEEAAVRAALETSSAGATPSALYDALATAEHFHFAGHGKSAGPDGIESALRISEHLQLTTSDILHLPRVPDTVVLAGCDLARSEPLATTLTLGAAQAFVVRGAQRVVAAVRPVADEDAVRFARLFYRALKEEEMFDAAFRAAQQQTREAAPDSDWTAFRMFGP
ncbi:MAG: CHAT domain-containing protein [Deltaproteobacteria bacterium]